MITQKIKNKIAFAAIILSFCLTLVGCSKNNEKSPLDSAATNTVTASTEATDYSFRNEKLLTLHYEKHGIDMGFDSPESYEKAASNVINNPKSLSKEEVEDGDFVFYLEETNEFVVLSTDGYIRTYFLPDAGKKYYDRQ